MEQLKDIVHVTYTVAPSSGITSKIGGSQKGLLPGSYFATTPFPSSPFSVSFYRYVRKFKYWVKWNSRLVPSVLKNSLSCLAKVLLQRPKCNCNSNINTKGLQGLGSASKNSALNSSHNLCSCYYDVRIHFLNAPFMALPTFPCAVSC